MAQITVLVIASILATVGAHLCFKQGVVVLGELNFSLAGVFHLIWQVLTNIWLLTGMILFGLSFLLWVVIISRLQLNIIYPIVIGSEVTLVAILSWFLFREYLAFWQIAGIAAIILGIFLLLKG